MSFNIFFSIASYLDEVIWKGNLDGTKIPECPSNEKTVVKVQHRLEYLGET